jgi:hypothetical protein
VAVTSQIGGNWNIVHATITFLATGTGFSILANAVNTFPVPDNKYGRWLLSVAQSIVGQKARSLNTSNNQDTVTVATTKKTTNSGSGG